MNRTHTILAIVTVSVLFALSWAQDDTTAPEDAPPLGTIAAVLAESSDFSTLVSALDAAGLTATFEGDGPYTLFAPTDAAFARLLPERLNQLIENEARLSEILQYHAVADTVLSETLLELDSLVTLSDAELSVRVIDQVVYIGDAVVTAVDIQAANGVIHVIDTVLTPPETSPETSSETE